MKGRWDPKAEWQALLMPCWLLPEPSSSHKLALVTSMFLRLLFIHVHCKTLALVSVLVAFLVCVIRSRERILSVLVRKGKHVCHYYCSV